MKLLYIEPYYGDSHRNWIKQFKNYSAHDIDIIKLPGNKWKWRMHGGAISLAEQFIKQNKIYDLILCSDFLNLPVFKSLTANYTSNIPFVMYFHENQISYPWPNHDPDKKLERDFHYYYINQTSALVSDWSLFNSFYNKNSFLAGLEEYLQKMPDNQNMNTIRQIDKKSSILHLGCELKKFDIYKINQQNKIPIILWNHRWEYDKNPQLFFDSLFKIKKLNVDFNLIVLGEQFSRYPEIFDIAKKELSDEIIHWGYCESFEEYSKWLWKSDIIPVTSNQDFFGISIVEAVYCNSKPILPNNLAYPEIFDISKNKKIFYNNESDFFNQLHYEILNFNNENSFSNEIARFDWTNMIKHYDKTFSKLKEKFSEKS